MALAVSDRLSNRPEQLTEVGSLVKRGTARRAVFELIYSSQKKSWTPGDVEERLGFKKRRVMEALDNLASHAVIESVGAGRSRTFGKVPFIANNKRRILDFADSPAKAASIATKRNPGRRATEGPVSLSVRREPYHFGRTRQATCKIAFVASNSDHESFLRLDRECREIMSELKRSKFRDRIEMVTYPAARVTDLLDALNEYRPDVVHFSGHGSRHLIFFESGDIEATANSVPVDYSLMKRILSATSAPPKLIFLNACETADGVEELLSTVRAAVAMTDSIGDTTAIVVAARFYAAIAAGETISRSLEQGKIVATAAGYDDADLPKAIFAEGEKDFSLTHPSSTPR